MQTYICFYGEPRLICVLMGYYHNMNLLHKVRRKMSNLASRNKEKLIDLGKNCPEVNQIFWEGRDQTME